MKARSQSGVSRVGRAGGGIEPAVPRQEGQVAPIGVLDGLARRRPPACCRSAAVEQPASMDCRRPGLRSASGQFSGLRQCLVGSDFGSMADLLEDGGANAEDESVELADRDLVLNPGIAAAGGVGTAVGEDAADDLDALGPLGEVERRREVAQEMRVDVEPGLLAE